jgi:hypothetical protein
VSEKKNCKCYRTKFAVGDDAKGDFIKKKKLERKRSISHYAAEVMRFSWL